MAYGLDLPLVWRIHCVFHVPNLERFHRSSELERAERPHLHIVVNSEEEYEVEAILRHKCNGNQHQYLVMWACYPIIEASWEPQSHLQNGPLTLEDYLCWSA